MDTVIYLSYESHNDESVECFMTAAAVMFNIVKVEISLIFLQDVWSVQVSHEDHDENYRTKNINIIKLNRK